MPGFNANYRNLSTDKDYSLRFDAGRTTASGFMTLPPQQGLMEIECGQIVTRELTQTTFKSLFRFDDLIACQRFFSFLCTFRVDDEDTTVTIYVRSAAFEPFVTLWRSSTTRFHVNVEESTAVEKVIEITTTADTVGPFILEITSMNPYETGEFEVEMVCSEETPTIHTPGFWGTQRFGFAAPNADAAVAVGFFGPYTPESKQLTFDDGETYTWAVEPADWPMYGISITSDGLVSGELNDTMEHVFSDMTSYFRSTAPDAPPVEGDSVILFDDGLGEGAPNGMYFILYARVRATGSGPNAGLHYFKLAIFPTIQIAGSGTFDGGGGWSVDGIFLSDQNWAEAVSGSGFTTEGKAFGNLWPMPYMSSDSGNVSIVLDYVTGSGWRVVVFDFGGVHYQSGFSATRAGVYNVASSFGGTGTGTVTIS